MAFTSFTVRNTISDGGSSLRRTKVTQNLTNPDGLGDAIYDSGLRSDGFFIPVPQSYLESTFEINVYRRDEISLEWTIATPLVENPTDIAKFEPVELLIRASSSGEPVTANDGILVKAYTYNDYAEELIDKNRPYIIEGGWVYYSLFLKYSDSGGDAFYEKVADLSIQIPIDFKSTEALWKRIPTYYRELDQDYATKTPNYDHEDGPLYRFIELFGWEMDRFRTTIYDTMRINDPDVIHSSAIDALATQTGVEFGKYALGTTKLRSILNNIGYLRRSKGTQDSVEAYISALTGCGVDSAASIDVNSISEPASPFGGVQVNSVAYGDGRWVIVGSSGRTSTSTNGTTWSTFTTVGNTRQLYSVSYGNGLFIAVGASASNSVTPCIYKSTDGVTWTGVLNSVSTGYYLLRDVVYENGVWVAVGQKTTEPLICVSSDGTTWTTKSSGLDVSNQLFKVAFGNNKWFATSSSGRLSVSVDNGNTWEFFGPDTLVDIQHDTILYANSTWLITVATDSFKSEDDGDTWTQYSSSGLQSNVVDTFYRNNRWFAVTYDGEIYSSRNGVDWELIMEVTIGTYLNSVAVSDNSFVTVGGTHIFKGNLNIIYNVHPMRVNLFSDPFFNQGITNPSPADSGLTQRKWTSLDEGGKKYGWGVISTITPTDPPSFPSGYTVSVSNNGDKLTVTFPALVGNATVLVYSRTPFTYNNDLTYYYSANASHDFTPRILPSNFVYSTYEGVSPPGTISYLDSWNDDALGFESFEEIGTRKIKATTPYEGVNSPGGLGCPVFVFDIGLSGSEETVITIENPLVEYRNASGEFFTGSTPMGGFIPNAEIGSSPSAGSYDYHWGANASSNKDRDFSFYTLDFQRSKSVTIDVVSNYIMPVTLVNGVDYEINWEVLE
jgi:photosystem II stability/assembly factor-like uncharacterized protein